ncbi:hypothetical protein ACLMJK_003684 [Lecanora helva]
MPATIIPPTHTTRLRKLLSHSHVVSQLPPLHSQQTRTWAGFWTIVPGFIKRYTPIPTGDEKKLTTPALIDLSKTRIHDQIRSVDHKVDRARKKDLVAVTRTKTAMQEESSYSEPEYAQAGRPKSDYSWYLENIDKHNLPEVSGSDRLEPLQMVENLISEVVCQRDEAFAIRTYPCTGLGVWLCPYIYLSPAYQAILEKLKSGGSIMDVGCFLGMDLRRLVYDGAPSDRMYAVDIVSHWDTSYHLFNDEQKFEAKFIESDFLASENADLDKILGKIDIISVSAVLHQWLWEKQVEAAKKLVQYSSGPRAMIVGYQIGNQRSRELIMNGTTVPVRRHDPVSFARMWDQVGSETGTKWQTIAELRWWSDLGWDPKDYQWMDKGDRVLDFVVTRLE